MKILIISSNLIGDTILSTGIVNHYYKKYPKAKFTFIIGPSAAQIYNNFPSLDKIIIIKKKKFNYHWVDMYMNVYKTRWDIVIDFRSSLISYLLLTKQRYIFKNKKNMNHLDQLKKFFDIEKMSLSISTNIEDEIKANNLVNINYRHVVLFPGGNWNPKIWPIEYFNQLAHILSTNFANLKFIIVGSLDEKIIYLDKIMKNLPQEIFIDLMGETLATTSAYMRKSNLFIGNDSGLMHLSIASNLKTIALFGPTDDKIYGHNSKTSFIIRTKERYESFDRKKIDPKISYMKSIYPEDVFELIIKNELL